MLSSNDLREWSRPSVTIMKHKKQVNLISIQTSLWGTQNHSTQNIGICATECRNTKGLPPAVIKHFWNAIINCLSISQPHIWIWRQQQQKWISKVIKECTSTKGLPPAAIKHFRNAFINRLSISQSQIWIWRVRKAG